MKPSILILSIILCNAFGVFAQQYPYNYNPPKKELTPAEEQAIADSINYAEYQSSIKKECNYEWNPPKYSIGDEIFISKEGDTLRDMVVHYDGILIDLAIKQIQCLYKHGEYTEAVKILKEIDNMEWSQYMLATCYKKGQGVTQSYSDAAYWYRKAAEQGDKNAQYELAYAYKYGEGVPQSYSDAAYWYRKAAEQGDVEAQGQLGVFYSHGKGVLLNHTEAVFWFRKAAEQGEKTAQYNLGLLYEQGRGIGQDYWQARHWYKKGAAQGYEKAIEALRGLDAEGK